MGDGQFGNLFKKTRGHDMKVLSIIPARGGSKGIHLKNLATINEKPMLFYTVNASLNSSIINKTIVRVFAEQSPADTQQTTKDGPRKRPTCR